MLKSDKWLMLKNRQQRLEGFKPSKRYNTLKINILVSILFCRFFNFNYLDSDLKLYFTYFLLKMIFSTIKDSQMYAFF
ncbi:MAG: hypothetical protein RL329_3649 [Bacteroidota bacterium]|jgi:hypothetical protein